MRSLTPKQEFQRDKQRLAEVSKLLDDATFQAAVLASYNQFCWSLPSSENPQHGWNANCRRAGAKAFIEELMAITETRVEKQPISQNLESTIDTNRR